MVHTSSTYSNPNFPVLCLLLKLWTKTIYHEPYYLSSYTVCLCTCTKCKHDTCTQWYNVYTCTHPNSHLSNLLLSSTKLQCILLTCIPSGTATHSDIACYKTIPRSADLLHKCKLKTHQGLLYHQLHFLQCLANFCNTALPSAFTKYFKTSQASFFPLPAFSTNYSHNYS